MPSKAVWMMAGSVLMLGGSVLMHRMGRADDCTNNTHGPDVIVGEIGDVDGSDVRNWGSVGDVTAFSFATTSCNKGDASLSWIEETPAHPVIAQNLYRLTTATDTSTAEPVKRFEQIGLAWLKHGFLALNQKDC